MTLEQSRAIKFYPQPWQGASVYDGVQGTF